MVTQVTSLDLSFAELAFVLSTARVDVTRTAEWIGVPAARSESELARAGLASLCLRGYGAMTGANEVEVSPAVSALAAGLIEASTRITVAVVSDSGGDVVQIFRSPLMTLLVRLLPLSCFRFDAFSTDLDVAALIAGLVIDPGMKVAAVISVSGSGEAAELSVRADASGSLVVGERSGVDRSGLVAAIVTLVGAVVA